MVEYFPVVFREIRRKYGVNDEIFTVFQIFYFLFFFLKKNLN